MDDREVAPQTHRERRTAGGSAETGVARRERESDWGVACACGLEGVAASSPPLDWKVRPRPVTVQIDAWRLRDSQHVRSGQYMHTSGYVVVVVRWLQQHVLLTHP